MKWVTRERPVIDRIACPWLISRFIDKEPEFLFVPPDQVLRAAAEPTQSPTTCQGSSSRMWAKAFVARYGLDGAPAIVTIAAIVRGARARRPALTTQSAG